VGINEKGFENKRKHPQERERERKKRKEKKDEGFFASESYVIPDCIKGRRKKPKKKTMKNEGDRRTKKTRTRTTKKPSGKTKHRRFSAWRRGLPSVT
jgi:hypothetical protein